jgi:hypothetical protein
MVLVIIVIGYVVLVISRLPVFRNIKSFNELSYVYDKRIALFLPKQGVYYLNVTGEVLFLEGAKIRVYNDKEDLVFSFPVSGFPSTFTVSSSGYYVVTLENVTVGGGARLNISEVAENFEQFLPFLFLDLIGKGVFSSGVAGFVLFFVFYSVFKRHQINKEIAEFQKTVQISNIIKIVYAPLSFIICPLAVIFLVSVIFTPLTVYFSVMIWLVLLPALVVFWLRLDKIVGFDIFAIGYKGHLSFRRIPKFLTIVVLLLYALTMYWSTQPTQVSQYLILSLTALGTFPAVAFLVLLTPFIDPLNLEGEAKLSLKQFLREYAQNPENADFGYINRASIAICSLLRSYNLEFSSDVLSGHISAEQLKHTNDKDANKEGSIIQRILISLDPFKPRKLIDIISDIPEINKKQSELTLDKILECLSYIAVIVGAILTVIMAIFRP